ncbi:restriction endonuclease subunit S [Micromonospora sp. NPDC047644]|uniref:restriction endonuclease subunit S n=1 Tax=Micromonospora sp. NPDC047644 TaxID=3157203 RepID=UPI0034537F44
MSLNLDKSTWKRVRLGDVIRRSRTQVDPVSSGVERYVAGGHVDSEGVTIERWGQVGDGQMGSTFRYVFKPGQVLFVSARPYLRKVGVPDFSGVVADKTYVLDTIRENGLLQEFLPFLLSSEAFVEYATAQATGSMNPRLLWGPMQRYEFDLPPIDEQRRLADLLQAVERHRQAVGAQIDRCLAVRAEHLQARMSDIAATAGALALDALIEPGRPITYGILMPGSGVEGGVPVVKVKDFPDGRVHEGNLLRTSTELAYEYRRSTLRAGDLLLSIRGTVGRLAEVSDSLDGANITQDTARLSIDQEHNRQYVRLALESDFVQAQMRRRITGLAVRGLNIGALREIRIPIPADRSAEERLVAESKVISVSVNSLKSSHEAAIDLGRALSAKVFGGDA